MYLQNFTNAAKLIGQCFIVQMANYNKSRENVTQSFLKAKKFNIRQQPCHSPDLNPIKQLFSY